MLKVENVSYGYKGSNELVLENVNVEFEQGTVYSIMGTSGAGKSTILSLLSGLENKYQGDILFSNKSIKTDTAKYRKEKVGIIFQEYNLLEYLNVIENVMQRALIKGAQEKNLKSKARELLIELGIEENLHDKSILKISGGQAQRVAIARSILSDDEIIFADEPTGSLDENTEQKVMKILLYAAHELNKIVIIVTHSPIIEKKCDVNYKLKNKKLEL